MTSHLLLLLNSTNLFALKGFAYLALKKPYTKALLMSVFSWEAFLIFQKAPEACLEETSL